jgi:hypothetical protein
LQTLERNLLRVHPLQPILLHLLEPFRLTDPKPAPMLASHLKKEFPMKKTILALVTLSVIAVVFN